MDTFEIVSKNGVPRSDVEPLLDEMAMEDEDNRDMFTPIEDMESAASSISRMSVQNRLVTLKT